MKTMYAVYEREARKQMALEYLDALRGKVSKVDLFIVESPALNGYEFDAIETAIDIANTYGFDIVENLHERARALIVSEGCDPAGFDAMLADAPSRS